MRISDWSSDVCSSDLPAGGTVLALGQAINLIVEKQDLAIEIAAQHMHGVVAADGQCVAVAGDDPHVQFRIGKFHAGRDGWRTAMNGVEAVGFQDRKSTRLNSSH